MIGLFKIENVKGVRKKVNVSLYHYKRYRSHYQNFICHKAIPMLSLNRQNLSQFARLLDHTLFKSNNHSFFGPSFIDVHF